MICMTTHKTRNNKNETTAEINNKRKMATQQWLALYFKKKVQSWSTVVEISHSRSLFKALKTLRFKKYICKSKKFPERLKSINFHHNMHNNYLQFH